MRYVKSWGFAVPSVLPAFLHDQMKARNWSQSQLAQFAGISESTLSNILNKPNVIPKPETLTGLANALEKSEAELTEMIGYKIDGAASPDSHHIRIARLLQQISWLSQGVEKLLALPENEQEDIVRQIEYRLSRSQKGRN